MDKQTYLLIPANKIQVVYPIVPFFGQITLKKSSKMHKMGHGRFKRVSQVRGKADVSWVQIKTTYQRNQVEIKYKEVGTNIWKWNNI